MLSILSYYCVASVLLFGVEENHYPIATGLYFPLHITDSSYSDRVSHDDKERFIQVTSLP